MAPKRNNGSGSGKGGGNGKKTTTTDPPPTPKTNTNPSSGDSSAPTSAVPTSTAWPAIKPFPPPASTSAPRGSQPVSSAAQSWCGGVKACSSTRTADDELDLSFLSIGGSGPSPTPAPQPTSGQQGAAPATTGTSTTVTKTDGAQKKDKAKKDPFKVEPPETYATAVSLGKDGKALRIRANMFQLQLNKGLDHFYVYTVDLPQINGRNISNRKVMKEFITRTLAQHPFVTQGAMIATDWQTYIVSLVDLRHQDPVLANIGAPITVTITWRNQAQPAAQTWSVGVQLTHRLPVQPLRDFCQGVNQNVNVMPQLFCLNILTRKSALESGQPAIQVGSNKLFNPLPAISWNAHGLEARLGYFNSVLACQGKPVINVHPVTGVFIRSPQQLLTYAARSVPGFNYTHPNFAYNMQSAMHIDFKTELKGLHVRYLYNPPDQSNPVRSPVFGTHPGGRSRCVNGFGASAHAQIFMLSNNTTITVENYFNQHVLQPPRRIQYPSLPCINTGSVQPGQEKWVPPELLELEAHQPLRGALPDQIMTLLQPQAIRRPAVNATMAQNAFAPGNIFNVAQLHTMNLAVTPQLMNVDARVLPIMDLHYRGSFEAGGTENRSKLRDGKWKIQGRKFHVSGRLDALGVIEVRMVRDDPTRRPIYQRLANACSTYGMTHAGANRSVEIASAPNSGRQALQNAINELNKKLPTQPSIVLVVLSVDYGAPAAQRVYAEVKTYFDTDRGINSVCLTEKNLESMSPVFMANLVLKFNVKTGGVNHVLDNTFSSALHQSPNGTMVIGADVTHPGAGAVPRCPSVAAVVASRDRQAVSFPGDVCLQKSKQEIIADLQQMVLRCLRRWYMNPANKQTLPGEILFYRDVVSDSQFAQVKSDELPQIPLACADAARKLGLSKYEPKITLVICSKRHHTRFFVPTNMVGPTNRAWWKDQNDNFVPGLVVDDPSIRNPFTFDFYLQSHKALAGTARPCHYFVIHNDMRMDMDRLQKITFGLCWTFATALTPISYASPAYYADRLCERARMYLLPMLKGRMINPPLTDAAMLLGMPNLATATEDEKDQYACDRVKAGRVGGPGPSGYQWPGAGVSPNPRNLRNPHRGATLDKMFYI